MLSELFSIPSAGGIAGAGILYAGISLCITGPLIAERTIEKSGWTQQCARNLTAPPRSSASDSPSLNCRALIGTFYGQNGAAFCDRHGDAVASTFDVVKGLADHLTQLGKDSIPLRPGAAQSACGCAVSAVIEKERTAFALYAGTARVVTPRPIHQLDDELSRALSSPTCRRRV